MKILTSLIVGGSLMIGSALAQDSGKSPAKPAASATAQTAPGAAQPAAAQPAKVKKHRKHKKVATPANAKPAVSNSVKPAAPATTPAK